jgi:hypothetical protein
LTHLIQIFLLFIMSQSLTMANIDTYAYSMSYRLSFFAPKHSIDSELTSQKSIQEFSSDDTTLSYCPIQNIHRDTIKTNGGKVLFGRSRLKNHFELHGKKITVNERKRNKWVQVTATKLRDTKNSDNYQELVINEVSHEDYYKASYRLIGTGMIKFEDGSYLKLMSSSTHTNKKIGDITLAVNEQGDVYINQGHICGSIIHFETIQRNLPKTALEFLTNFTSDTDSEPWLLYTIDKKQKKIK